MDPRHGLIVVVASAVLAAVLPAVLPAAEVHALLDRSAEREPIIQALIALVHGDTQRLEDLPSTLFAAPTGLPDEGDPALVRRWPAALAPAIARLPASGRERALAALDRLYRAAARDAEGGEARARIALDFIPGRAALADLGAEADRSFDRGQFQRYLALTAVLGAGGDARDRVAALLSGSGTDVDPSLLLPPPGEPRPTTAVALAPADGSSVRWSIAPGWLLAADPWDRVRWQYRLEHRADVTVGAGGAVVRDRGGLRLIDETGRARALPPAPPAARCLAVAGGAAWFATGATVHRLDLARDTLAALELPGEPLAAPLVRGSSSLWLTASELVLADGTTVAHRLVHGLPARAGWRLGQDAGTTVVLADDGRAYRIGALVDQLADAPAPQRMQLLLAARRPAEALAIYGSDHALSEDAAARRLALRAHLALGIAQVRGHAAELRALAADGQERVTAWRACELAAGDGSSERADAGRAIADELAADSSLLVCMEADELAREPAQWSWVVGGADPSRAPWCGFYATLATARLGTEDRPAPPDPLAGPARRDIEGSWRYRGRRIRLDASATTVELTCHDDRGALAWRRRWSAPPVTSAPGHALAFRDGWVCVAEGQGRLRVFDLGDGAQRADVGLLGDGLPHQVVLLTSGRIALLGPVGVDTTLILAGSGEESRIPLPGPARWCIPSSDGALVALRDGRCIAYPGLRDISLPDALRTGEVPAVTAAGLVAGGRLWPWIY